VQVVHVIACVVFGRTKLCSGCCNGVPVGCMCGRWEAGLGWREGQGVRAFGISEGVLFGETRCVSELAGRGGYALVRLVEAGVAAGCVCGRYEG
jgi:hypothetical protein